MMQALPCILARCLVQMNVHYMFVWPLAPCILLQNQVLTDSLRNGSWPAAAAVVVEDPTQSSRRVRELLSCFGDDLSSLRGSCQVRKPDSTQARVIPYGDS